MTDTVEIRLLGEFAVVVGDRTIGAADFERRSGAELVQLLALAPGRRLHREQVIDRLWPDAEVAAAGNRLNKAATFARNALGTSQAIVVRDGGVALLPDHDVGTDVDAFESEHPDRAIEHYGGELLPDSPYAEWALEPRRRLRQRYLELLAAAGRWHEIAAADPADETAQVALMQLALDNGDPQAAIRRFHDLTDALLEAFGTEPGTAATELCRAAEAAASAETTVSGMRAFVAVVVDADRTRRTSFDRTVFSSPIEANGGSVIEVESVDAGAVFSAVGQAVAAGIALQEQVRTDTPDLGLRIGIEVGHAQARGGTWSGTAPDRAAAVACHAPVGHVVCTGVAADLARPDLAGGVRLVDTGRYRLAGFGPTRLHQVTAPGLADRSSVPRSALVGGRLVDVPGTPIVGREDALTMLAEDLQRAGLVTIVGAGGAGKTLLAQHLGARLLDRFEDGVWMCEFGNIEDAGGARRELLAAIGGRQHSDADVIESIVRTLADRRALILLDNCEHVAEEVASLADHLLAECPTVALVATSRVPLRLDAEVEHRLPELDRTSAIELFCGEAARFGVPVDPGDAAVDRICARLGDLPLAVKLAAARTRSLDARAIESLLDGQLDRFRNPSDGAPEHHRTLRAAIRWSFDALTPSTQRIAAAMSVMANRLDLHDAVAVSGAHHADVADSLDELVEHGLIRREVDDDRTTYRMVESVRLFARERLEGSDARDRHLDHFAARARRVGDTMVDWPARAFGEFGRIADDLRSALSHAMATGRADVAFELLGGVGPCAVTSLSFEYVDWCEAAFGPDPTPPAGAAAACAMGCWATLLSYRGDTARGRLLGERARAAVPEEGMTTMAVAWLDMAEEKLDEARAGWSDILDRPARTDGVAYHAALIHLVLLGVLSGQDSRRYRHLAAIDASNGDDVKVSVSRLIDGLDLLMTDPVAALACVEESVVLSERHGCLLVTTSARGVLQLIAGFVSRPDACFESLIDTMHWAKDRGMWVTALNAFIPAAELLDGAGEPDMAITLLGARGASVFSSSYIDTSALIERLRAANPQTFATAWDAGDRLSPPQAVEVALSTFERVLAACD